MCLLSRYNGFDRNHWLSILFGISSWSLVFTIIENWIQLEKIFYQSTIIVNEWIFRRSLHICIILDLFIRNGSCLLKNNIISHISLLIYTHIIHKLIN